MHTSAIYTNVGNQSIRRMQAQQEMSAIDSITELNQILEQWDQENGSGADPLPTLTRMAELMEKETEAYLKMDPDPFDDRHPGRTDPNCTLGHLLKALFKNDNFMTKLINNYLLHRENRDLNTAAARLTVDIMPGLETSVIFQETEGLIPRLYQWAEFAHEPLRSYATGLLAAAMEIQDIAGNYREQNSHLIPIMLQRLHELRREEIINGDRADQKAIISEADKQDTNPINTRPFAHLISDDASDTILMKSVNDNQQKRSIYKAPTKIAAPPPFSSMRFGLASPRSHVLNTPTLHSENSNSSWAEMEAYVIGSHQMYPLASKMQQRLILQYLTAMGEYQEMLVYVFEHNSLNLILHYISLKENKDVRLAFEALKYLAALLCHKKFAIEFVTVGGLQHLLEVYRPSIAATGVSMCLYYLAYSEDALERVCLLQHHVLADLVRYALWLLECSHESSRCHATMFFSLSFQFRAILELFDQQDGLRKLYNMISTLQILSVDDVVVAETLTDDEIFGSRQTARQVCIALKRYYEAHLAIKADQLGRSHSRNQGLLLSTSPCNIVPPYKAAKFSPETIQQNIETLLELLPLRANWAPVDELHRLSGVTLLLQLIAMAYEWNYSGRAETVRSALDVIGICSVVPKIQFLLCEPTTLPDAQNVVGMSILLGAAEGEIISDPEVQKAALNVINNCVCCPTARLVGYLGRIVSGNAKKRATMRSGEDLVSKLWNCVRSHNGIMILLNLLTIKTPITDADAIRALACKALVGLARSETVKQIISKLPLFTNGQLQVLMREPVLQDNRSEHLKFCHYAMQLIERVTGKPLATGVESSIAKINKADVVAQTKIVYNEKELLQLIHQHLIKKGLAESAASLQREAGLPPGPPRISLASRMLSYTPPPPLPVKTNRMTVLPASSQNVSSSSSLSPHTSAFPGTSNNVNGYIGMASSAVSAAPSSSAMTTNPLRVSYNSNHHHHEKFHTSKSQGSLLRTATSAASSSCSQLSPVPSASLNPPTSLSPLAPSFMTAMGATTTVPPVRNTVSALQKNQMRCGNYQQSPIMKRQNQTLRSQCISTGNTSALGTSCSGAVGGAVCSVASIGSGSITTGVGGLGNSSSSSSSGRPVVTLDTIVTEYLRKQHALCRNPVVTCPPFDLFIPHRCPDPVFRNSAPVNITARLQRRVIFPRFGGIDGAKMDRKFVYSRFRPFRTYRDPDDSDCFTCCAFSTCDQYLIFGTSSGALQLYNIESGQKEVNCACHSSAVTHCEPSKAGQLILTSNTWRRPLSALWRMGDNFELKQGFEEDCYVEFSKQSQDRIIGTRDDGHAIIYDLATGQNILTLKDPEMANNYTQNRATFHPSDELVLSDGVLWDVRRGNAVHKFDKFNPHISGVFHPNGLEIVANSEIWDVRTFHLLHTVPALDQCQITFNNKGDVIYGVISEEDGEMLEGQVKSPFGSSFRTFDSTDYSNIATNDIKKNIFDLCTDKSDCYLAIIENQGPREGYSSESICRVYEVGRSRAEDDETEDEDEDDEDGVDMGGSEEDDDDDDDDIADSDDDEEEDDEDDEDTEGHEDYEDRNSSSDYFDMPSEEEEEDDNEMLDDDEDDDDDILFSLNEDSRSSFLRF